MRAWRVCHNAHKVQKDMRHEIHVLLMLKNEFVSTSCKRPTATPPSPLPTFHSSPFTSALHFVCAAKQFGVWNGSGQWRGPHSQLEFIQHFAKVASQLHCSCCCCSSIYALDSLATAAAPAKSLRVHVYVCACVCVCCFLLACVFAAFATFNWSKLVLSGFSILRCAQHCPSLFRLFNCNWKGKAKLKKINRIKLSVCTLCLSLGTLGKLSSMFKANKTKFASA